MNSRPVGIIAGMNEELQPLMTEKTVARELHGVRLYYDQFEKTNVVMAWAGIGKVAAATAAATLMIKCNVRALFVTGTAAAVSGAPGRVYFVTRAFQHDYGSDEPRHYRPGLLPIGPVTMDPVYRTWDPEILGPLFEKDANGKEILRGLAASGDQFITNTEYVNELKKVGVDVIDMETAAVAQVAEAAGLPWVAIKATTDEANEGSDKDFLENLNQAAALAAEATKRAVQLF